MSLTTVLDALSAKGSDPKGSNGSFMAKCPSHADGRPSLSITEKPDGQVLIKCFAGCDYDKIVADLGLTKRDLFPDRPDNQRSGLRTPWGRPLKTIYEYKKNGEVYFSVGRNFNKADGFPQWTPTGAKVADLPDEVRGLPFQYDHLAANLAITTRRAIHCEGEADVLAINRKHELGTTMSGGADASKKRARIDAYVSHLMKAGVRELMIVADRDTAGREHASRVAQACQRAGLTFTVTEFFCEDDCKDPRAAINAHGDDWLSMLQEWEVTESVTGALTALTNVDTLPLTRENSPEKCQRTVNVLPKVSTLLLSRLGIMGEFATSLASSMQVDPEFALTAALATVGLPVGLSVNVEVRSHWVEPAIIQVLLVAPPSERKTPVLHACMVPLFDAERKARESRKAEIAHAKAVEAQLELAKSEARRTGGYQAACERLETHTIPNEFRAFLGKATAEALEVHATRHGERMGRVAVVSDEGGAVFGDLGRYQSAMNWELLLAGYDARRYSSERLTRDSVLVDELRIPLFLMLQPSAWDAVKSDPAASGRGVLSRLSPVRPRSLVGERFGFGPTVPKVLSARWAQMLTALFSEAYASDQATKLTVSDGALEKWLEFKDRVEVELGDGTFEGDLLTGWGGKKAGRALRLAAIVHAALTGRLGGEISDEEMSLGIELAEWLGLHALREFGGAGVAALLSRDARRLAEVAESLDEFTRREAMRKLHRWTLKRFTKAAQELEELGLIESQDIRGMRWKWLENSESVNALPKVSTQVSTLKTDITPGQGTSVNVVNAVNAPVDTNEIPEVIHRPEKPTETPSRTCSKCSRPLALSTGDLCKVCQAKRIEWVSDQVRFTKQLEPLRHTPDPQPPPTKPADLKCRECERELSNPISKQVGLCMKDDPNRKESEPMCRHCERYLTTRELRAAGVCAHHEAVAL